MSSVRVVTSGSSIDLLRDAWEELQTWYAPGNVFRSYPWARVWWKHFDAGSQLLAKRLRSVVNG